MRTISQKTQPDPASKLNLPAYIRLPNGKIFRWLTLEHDQKTNINIGGEGATGSGFVIDERGFLITNKHVAAGWMTELDLPKRNDRGDSIVCDYFEPSREKPTFKLLRDCKITTVDELNRDRDLAHWDPERDGAVLFENDRPVYISSNDRRNLVGRNEVLDVRFPNERLSISANLIRASTDADVALIKVDSPQALTKVELADESDTIKQGERAMVLGYPAMSLETIASVTTEERGTVRTRAENIPVPTITDGIIARLGAPMQRAGNVTTEGTLGDVFQLQLPSTNGNSGGPVFNAAGKVIGIFTYRNAYYQNTTFGVPIKHARALLKTQR
jgi:S1-C subfamily serine protease